VPAPAGRAKITRVTLLTGILLLIAVSSIVAAVVHLVQDRASSARSEGELGVAALESLGARARADRLVVTAFDRRSDKRLLVELDDGTALDLFLFWPRTDVPLSLLDVRWWDLVGWVLEFEVPTTARRPFYAWRCRIAQPVSLDVS
jgi:hypothetical protein